MTPGRNEVIQKNIFVEKQQLPRKLHSFSNKKNEQAKNNNTL
jgi:hypothetical protein